MGLSKKIFESDIEVLGLMTAESFVGTAYGQGAMSGIQAFALAVNENGALIEVEPYEPPSINGDRDTVLYSGDVIWITGYTYYVWADHYKIDGREETTFIDATIVLDAAHASLDRLDIFLIQDDGAGNDSIQKSTGTPGADPVKNTLDASLELEISFAYVENNTTEPAGFNEVIYAEGAGSDWDITGGGTGIDTANTSGPITDTQDIKFTNVASDVELQFTKDTGTVLTDGYKMLTFDIKLLTGSPWEWVKKNKTTLDMYLTYNGVRVTSRLRLGSDTGFGFDGDIVNAVQTVSVRLDRFGGYYDNDYFNGLLFRTQRTSSDTFQVDNIRIIDKGQGQTEPSVGSIVIKDESIVLSSQARVLNFLGDGITAVAIDDYNIDITVDTSGYVPYTGATGNVDLNAKELDNVYKINSMSLHIEGTANEFVGTGTKNENRAIGIYNRFYGGAGSRSTGFANIGFGLSALQNAPGDENIAIGSNAGLYNEGDHCTWIGKGLTNAADWKDVPNAKNVADASTDVDTVLNRITIASHGFGANDDHIQLFYTTTGTAIGGITTNGITIWKIIDANTIEVMDHDDFAAGLTSQGTDVHTFTPLFAYNNSIAIGYGAVFTKSNQIVLGDANVTELVVGNYVFDIDQTLGGGQDNYVLTYNSTSGLISLEVATGGSGDPDQTLANTSDATSHTVTLSGTNQGSIQLVEGTGVTLDTTGTGLDGIVTINASPGAGIGGSITDDQIAVGAATANEIEGDASFRFAKSVSQLYIGIDDTQIGQINLYGSASGGGGLIRFYAGATVDDFPGNYFMVRANDGNFTMAGSGANEFLRYIVATDVLQLPAAVIEFPDYGGGTITGTATYFLAVDVDGKIIEEAIPGGADQTLANTSDATSHTVTLSGTNQGSIQLVEGTGITLDTTGTGLDGIVTINATAGGATFTSLTDVDEADYVGHAGDLVRVNATPDGLEFVDGTTLFLSNITGETFSDLSDIPAEPTGGAVEYYLKYNDTGDTFTWVDITTLAGSGIGGSIADNQIAVGATTANNIEGSTSLTFVAGALGVGVEDTTQGIINVYGGAGGLGGRINLRNAANDDTTNEQWILWANGGDISLIDNGGIPSAGFEIAESGAWQILSYGQQTFTGTATYMLAVDSAGNIIEEALPTGGGGFTKAVNQTTHGFAVDDAIRHNGTIWVKAQADVLANSGTLGVVTAVADTDNFTYQFGGLMTTGTWTNGVSYFLDPAVAGNIIAEPTYSVGEVREFIGTGTPDGLLIEIDLGDEIAAAGGSGDVATDDIWTAAGDLVVGTGVDTAAVLNIGTTLQYLRVNAGVTALEWATLPAAGATTLAGLTDVSSATQTAGFVLASSGGAYAGRALIAGDIPALSYLADNLTTLSQYAISDTMANFDTALNNGNFAYQAQTLVVGDHGTGTTDEVVNVCYGTSATPPTASGTTEGAIYIQHEA